MIRVITREYRLSGDEVRQAIGEFLQKRGFNSPLDAGAEPAEFTGVLKTPDGQLKGNLHLTWRVKNDIDVTS